MPLDDFNPDNSNNPQDLPASTQGGSESIGSVDIAAGEYDSLQIRLRR
ncbi:MAG: hypothetical protein ACOCYG_06425 [Spirochaetota bacterium]